VIDKYKDLPRVDKTLLYAEDLQGRAVTLKISDMVYEKNATFEDADEEKLTLKFDGKSKRLPLCKTNVRLLWALFGKSDPRKPIGKEITLQAVNVESFGEIVPAIRIKGAPWVGEDIRVIVPQGKKKVKTKLVKTERAAPPADPVAPSTVEQGAK